MACNRISTRISYASSLIISLLSLPFALQSGGSEFGIEFIYDHKGLSVFFSGAYKTDYIEAKATVNPYEPFLTSNSLQLLPVYKPNNIVSDAVLATALAGSLTVASGALLYAAQKEIERRREDQRIDLYLERCEKAIEKSDSIFEKMEKRATHD